MIYIYMIHKTNKDGVEYKILQVQDTYGVYSEHIDKIEEKHTNVYICIYIHMMYHDVYINYKYIHV